MKMSNEKQRWSLRKLTVGLTSVLVGLTFFSVSESQSVRADDGVTQNNTNEEQITDQQHENDNAVQKKSGLNVVSAGDIKNESSVKDDQTSKNIEVKDIPSKKISEEASEKLKNKDLQSTTITDEKGNPDSTRRSSMDQNSGNQTQALNLKNSQEYTIKPQTIKANKVEQALNKETVKPVISEWTYNTDNDEDAAIKLIGFTGKEADVVIPNAADFNSDSIKNVIIDKNIFNTIAQADENVKSIAFSGTDGKKVKAYTEKHQGDLNGAFSASVYQKNLTSIDASNLDVTNVTSFNSMFANLPKVKTIDVSGWNTNENSAVSYMFQNDPLLEKVVGMETWTDNTGAASDKNFWSMFQNDKSLTSVNLSKLGTNTLSSWGQPLFEGVFSDRTEIDLTNIVLPTRLANTNDDQGNLFGRMFSYNSKVEVIKGLDHLVNSKITNLYELFKNDPNLVSIKGMGDWDTSNVTNMASMFSGDVKLKDINSLSGWDTKKVTDFSQMFRDVHKLESLDISSFDFGAAGNKVGMYLDGYTFNLRGRNDLQGEFNLSNIKMPTKPNNNNVKIDLTGLVSSDKNITSIIGADGLVTSAVTGIASLFAGDQSLKTISGLDKWNTENVTNISHIFDCLSYTYPNGQQKVESNGSLEKLNVSNWNMSNVTDMSNAFAGQKNLKTIQGLNQWTTSYKLKNLAHMFDSTIYPGTDTQQEYAGDVAPAGSLTELDFGSHFDTSGVTDMSYMFAGQKDLKTISGINDWNTSNVTNMGYMFHGAEKLDNLDLKRNGDIWNTHKVTDMRELFSNNKAAKDYSFVSTWNVDNVTDMSYMFVNDYSLEKLGDLSNWNTSKVGSNPRKNSGQNFSFAMMFSGCKNLSDLSGLDKWAENVQNVHDTRMMFSGTKSLKNIDLHNWKTSKLQIADRMFSGSGVSNLNLQDMDFSHLAHVTGSGYVTNSPVTNTLPGAPHSVLRGDYHMFYNLQSPARIDLSNADLPNTENPLMAEDFYGKNPLVVISNNAVLKQLNSQKFGNPDSSQLNAQITGHQNANIITFKKENSDQKLATKPMDFVFENDAEADDVLSNVLSHENIYNLIKSANPVFAELWNKNKGTGYQRETDPVTLPKSVPDVWGVYVLTAPRQAELQFIDEDKGNQVLSSITSLGDINEQISFGRQAQKYLNDYIKAGYVFDKVDGLTNAQDPTKAYTWRFGRFNADDSKDQNFFVYLKHGKELTSDQKTVTETIHYVYQNGNKASADKTETVEFTRTGEKDKVTGDVTWTTDWQPSVGTIPSVKSPLISGYTADILEVPAKQVTAKDGDSEITVTYTKNHETNPEVPSDNHGHDTTPEKPDKSESVNQNKPVASKKHQKKASKKVSNKKSSYTLNNGVKGLNMNKRSTRSITSSNSSPLSENSKMNHDVQVQERTNSNQNVKNLPQTGDKNTTVLGLISLALGLGVGLLGLVIDHKRKD